MIFLQFKILTEAYFNTSPQIFKYGQVKWISRLT